MTEPALTSTKNPRVRAAAGLRDRRERDEAGLTLVDGARELARALAGDAVVVEVFVDEDRLAPEGAAVVVEARRRGAAIVPVAGPVLDRLAYGDRSEGLVATVRIPGLALAGLRLPGDALVVVVEGLEKPGNLGAVLRTADAAGADAVIAADPRTDVFNPNAVRASLGRSSPSRSPRAPAPSSATSSRVGVALLAARVDAETLYTDVDLRVRSPSSSGARPTGSPTRGRPGRAADPGADARDGRQPERVHHGCRPALRGTPAARAAPGRALTPVRPRPPPGRPSAPSMAGRARAPRPSRRVP